MVWWVLLLLLLGLATNDGSLSLGGALFLNVSGGGLPPVISVIARKIGMG